MARHRKKHDVSGRMIQLPNKYERVGKGVAQAKAQHLLFRRKAHRCTAGAQIMRIINDHQVNPANDLLVIAAKMLQDQRANHRYAITGFDTESKRQRGRR